MSANFRKYYLKPCLITKFGIIAHVLPLTAHCSRLIAHVLASLVLEIDVMKLENVFVNGYPEEDRVLYVSMFDSEDGMEDVPSLNTKEWNVHWKASMLELSLSKDEDMQNNYGKMFFD